MPTAQELIGYGHQAWCIGIALKLHFTTPNYDIFKYDGEVKNNGIAYFKKNKSRGMWSKLGLYMKKKGVYQKALDFLAAQYLYADKPYKSIFVPDMMDENAINRHLKYVSDRGRMFQQFINDFEIIYADARSKKIGINEYVVPVNGQSHLFNLYEQDKIDWLTMIAFDWILNIAEAWDNETIDHFTWPDVRSKISKCSKFYEIEAQDYIDHINTRLS